MNTMLKKFAAAAAMAATMATAAATTPTIISSQVRSNDPTVLDVVYKVTSDKPTVNVRALAFEDGERSFWKVVRPETFIDGTAANIGDNIAANVEHTLSWKVSTDWATDLAKVKLDWVKIPGVNGVPDIEVSYNSQTAADVINALYWYYASGVADLTVYNGYLKNTNGVTLVSRTTVSDKFVAIEYIAEKMGLEQFGYSSLYHYAFQAMRKYPQYSWQAFIAKGTSNLTGSRYIGEKAYCVIDVSGGNSASSYPVTYLDSCPINGWGDEYKTTKILLRRIEPGTVTLRDTKPVTLTKPFYIGVFEITQKQYQLVAGSNPSSYKGDMRPVEYVSWNDIRGNSSTYDWPNVTTVGSSSFMGRLQAKTGLNFDLPTESQWEYACRAGTTSYYNNGGSNDNDLKQLGRFSGNLNDGRGGYSQHTTVGSYSPNAWGLYDMHGNVCEWCLDWYAGINSDPATDFLGAASGSNRVLHGASWRGSANSAESSYCGCNTPDYRFNYYGFRLVRTLSTNE